MPRVPNTSLVVNHHRGYRRLLAAMVFHRRPMKTITFFVLAVLALPLAAAADSQSNAKAMLAKIKYNTLITVNDADAIGTVGDQRLSLAEAIRLANGSLALSALSDYERAQVQGLPGKASRDKVQFKVPGGAVRFPLQIQEKPFFDFAVLSPNTLMPAVEGNEGDAFVGNGIRFTNGPDDAVDTLNNPKFFVGAPLGGKALSVLSSDVIFTGITFERFITTLSMQPPANSAGISDVKIVGNKFYNSGGLGFTATNAGNARSAVRHVDVSDNEFRGPAEFGENFPSKFLTAISLNAGAAGGPGTYVIEDVDVSENVIKQYTSAVQAQALQSIFSPSSGARMSGVHIKRNKIVMAPNSDPAIYLWGGVSVFGDVSDIQVNDLLIQHNDIVADGFVIFVTGVESLLGGQQSKHVEVTGVKVIGNHIKANTSCVVGVTTIVALTEQGSPGVVDSSMNAVEVAGNRIEGCEWGAFASPVYNWGTPGTSTGNSMQSVAYRQNFVTEATNGIVVAGGALSAAAPGDASTGVVGNELTRLTIENNFFAASDAGFTIAGGLAKGSAPGFISQNRVAAKDLSPNINARGVACKVENNLAIDSPATVINNVVTGVPTASPRDWFSGSHGPRCVKK